MGSSIRYFIFILLILQYQIVSAMEPITVMVAVTTIVYACQVLWDAIDQSKLLDRHSVNDKLSVPFIVAQETTILNELKRISIESKRIQTELHSLQDKLLHSTTIDIAKLHQLNHGITKIFINSFMIDNTYTDFLRYIEGMKTSKYDDKLLIEFAENAISPSACGLEEILTETHGLLMSHRSTNKLNILDMLLQKAELFLTSTNESQSPQQLIYNLLLTVVYSEVKSYHIIQYAYSILTKLTRRDYGGFVWKSNKFFYIRLNQTMSIFKEKMRKASRQLLRSDPDHHVEGETYTELKKVFQAYIVNEINLRNADIKAPNCEHYCDSYKDPNFHELCYRDTANEGALCRSQVACVGGLYDCGYKIQNDMEVCLSVDQFYRRYEFVRDGRDKTLGKKNVNCARDLIKVERRFELKQPKFTSIRNFADDIYRAINYCDACVCTCYRPDWYSDNRFMLGVSNSRISENFVITGIRIVKENYTVHIQAQEGQLMPNGLINETSIRWIPIPKTNHYYRIEWENFKEISLDDLQTPKNHAITSIGFTETKNIGKKWRLGLMIVSKPINFTSGKVLEKKTEGIWATPSSSPSDEIPLRDSDLPTNIIAKSTDRSRSGQYVTLQHSGLDADVGQSTIPFFDIQPVITNPPAPLSGAGIYHKGRQGSGGFIGLKVFTYDYEQHVKPDLKAKDLL